MPKFDSNLFSILLKERKTIRTSPIVLVEKGTKYMETKVPAVIAKLSHSIDFIANKQRYIMTKYLLQLRCSEFHEKPYFRLDSDGPAHRNKKNGGKIVLESIPTPHFNTFDELGRTIAYKSNILKNAVTAKELQNDIGIGVKHFCEEANLRLNKAEYPVIDYKIPELPLNSKIVDPNSTVTFKL